MPIIIAILTFMFLFTLLFALKRRAALGSNQMKESGEEELSRTLTALCKRLRITEESGYGVNSASLYAKIASANRLIAAKLKRGEGLQEGEKWLYENLYLVHRYVFGERVNLQSLPHYGGKPRVVLIAEHIVNHSLNQLTPTRVGKILESMKPTLALTFAELRAFNHALSYAVLEQIYILAERILHQNKMKCRAMRGGIDRRCLKSDVYCYYLYFFKRLSEKEQNELAKLGIRENSSVMQFNLSIMENAMMAETLFKALRECGEFVPKEKAMRFLSSYDILAKERLFEKTCEDTKLLYFEKIEEISKRTNISEEYVSVKCTEFSAHNNLDISYILFDHKKELIRYLKSDKLFQVKRQSGIWKEVLYVASVLLLACGGAVGLWFLTLHIAVPILSLIPLIFIAENFLNYLLQHAKMGTEIPKMSYREIPHEHNVLVVVSEYIASVPQLKESIRHLEVIRECNTDPNISVSLLIDLKRSKSETDESDKELIDYIRNARFSDNINIFVRKRTKSGDIYQGHERKRGAIMALNRLLMTRDTSEFSYIYDENFVTPKYVATLDADNVVLPNGIRDMVNMIAHPYHLKYDLLANKNRYNLYSFKTAYSKRFLEDSGMESYPYFSGFYQRMFGKDIFCGKGIYKVAAFYKKLDGIFPSGKILSHDIIEGSVLKTGPANIIFEDAPVGFLSDRERRKRWQRGDIQLAPFLLGRWKNDEGMRVKVPISPLYRFVMGKNILYNLKDLCILVLGVIGLMLSPVILYAALGLFAMPYVINEIKILRGFAASTRGRYILFSTARNLKLMVEDFFMTGYYAVSNTLLFFGTLFRMLTGKKLLEWKTYYNSQTAKKPVSYVREITVPFLVLTVIGCAFILFQFSFLYFNLFALLCLGVFLSHYFTSEKPLEEQAISTEGKDYLLEIARKTYKYFSYMRAENGIIADNLQLKPYKGISKTTSPTNIGFSILSELCAYYLGFSTLEETKYYLGKTLDAVEKMDKWNGNLYNWYDTTTLKPINSFVSSVDSGNFLAALIAAKEFYKEQIDLVGELRTQLFINATKLDKLYDEERNLFFLGHDGEKCVGHYDLISSESRLLSTIFIAISGKSEHFYALGRDYVSYCGNTLLSWSGTMFEYLMPDLLLKLPRFSNQYRTSNNVSRIQAEHKLQGVWGISESGYYKFDEELRYQYYAFGLNALSLRNEQDKTVVSPYSSILALPYLGERVVENLKRLSALGMEDEYGFFESADMGGKIRIVSSFMTHHQGMILCAVTNYLRGDAIRNLLAKDPRIEGTLLLYNEICPKGKQWQLNREKPNKIEKQKHEYSKYESKIEYNYKSAVLSNAQYTIVRNYLGGGFCMANGNIISEFIPNYEEANGGFFYGLTEDNEVVSPTFLPQRKCSANHSVSYSEREITFQNTPYGLKEDITVFGGLVGEVRRFRAKYPLKRIAFYLPVAINTPDGYASHPAFNHLFVHAKVTEDNILVVQKRSMKKDKAGGFLAVAVRGVDSLRFECNKGNFLGRTPSVERPAILFGEPNGDFSSLGDVISPCIGFTGTLNTLQCCQVCILYGTSEEELLSAIRYLPENVYQYAKDGTHKLILSEATVDIAGELIYAPYPAVKLKEIATTGKREEFLSLSAGKKLISYTYREDNPSDFHKFLTILIELQLLRIAVKPVILVDKNLHKSVLNFIRESLKKNFYYDFVITEDASSGAVRWAFLSFSDKLRYGHRERVYSKRFEIDGNLNHIVDAAISPKEYVLKSGFGGFDERGAYVQQSAERTLRPYSNVIAAKYGGMLKTNRGGGFFYFENARENKMIRFDNDFVTDVECEFIYLKTALGYHGIGGGEGLHHATVIEKGQNIHFTHQNHTKSMVMQYMICEGKARVTEIVLENEKSEALELVYGIIPCLGWRYNPEFIYFEQNSGTITVHNILNDQKLYLRLITRSGGDIGVMPEKTPYPYFEYSTTDGMERVYVLASQDYALIQSLNPMNLPIYKEKELQSFRKTPVEIVTPVKSFDAIVNMLPYQIQSSRLNGKLGFYQVGGATGFRDQLQDSLAFLHRPEIVRHQIIYSCQHQYEAGDVMHWWHHPKFGLRTKITDDRLFLPYAVAEYIKWTGDCDILSYEVPYLCSPELSEQEESRLENPPYTEYAESVLKHCLRAIRCSLRYGEHKLPVMGTGDWNDGMDDAGSKGKGESVFNGILLYGVLQEFAPLCSDDVRDELFKIAEELKRAVNDFAFDKDRYRRLYTDDGRWLGSGNSSTLTLDILVQSYAVLSGIAQGSRADLVLDTAKELVDEELGIIKLLTPPQTKRDYLGYISAYPEGVRENGGQYTHAAMWYLMALTRRDRQEEAFRLFQILNPAEKCRNDEKNRRYAGEPYVFAGDIYSNKDNEGRMGWSWYTGSAAWGYRLVVEEFFGLKRIGDKLIISPRLPKALHGSLVTYTYEDSVYLLEYRCGERDMLTLNGELLAGNQINLEENVHAKIIVEVGKKIDISGEKA